MEDLGSITCLQFSTTFCQNFRGIGDQFALLTGFTKSNGQLDVFGTIAPSDSIELLLEKCQNVQIMLPAGVDIVGICKMVGDMNDGSVEPIIEAFSEQIGDQLAAPEPVIILCNAEFSEENEDDIVCYKYDKNGQGMSQIKTITFQSRAANTVSLRVVADLTVDVNGTLKDSYDSSFDELEDRLNRCSFLLQNEDLALILDESAVFCEVYDANTTCAQLYNHVNPMENKKKVRNMDFREDYLIFTPVQQMSRTTCPEAAKCVPVIYADNENQSVMHTIPLKFRAIAVCDAESTCLKDFAALLKEALLRQLHQFRETVLEFSSDRPVSPKIYRFFPGLAHFLMVAYPVQKTVAELVDYRKQLQSDVGLSTERPILRPTCVHKFVDERSYHIINVHAFANKPGETGVQSITQGNYQYHHYLQDNFDDKGWGCAYRSFQTVWSWFLLQGYTDKPVPNHRLIQKALVEVGDRDEKFVGTTQWIGSIELGYCLDHMLGITYRIITASNTDEMDSKARELAHHFDTHGTPVMIGGGVLAHTILGVYFDEETGDVRFLVLDPHYTGDENISTIIDKGWCGWKESSFWQRDAFYNMLLPSRPNMV